MKSTTTELRSEALAAAGAATLAGLNQSEIATAVGVSQSQVSRIFSGKSRRRSKNFEKICIYAYESLGKSQGNAKPSASTNQDLMTALDAVWDGSDQHAKALATVIHSLGGLEFRKEPIGQTPGSKSSTTRKPAQ